MSRPTTMEINRVEYVKKSEYDKLKATKTKIEKVEENLSRFTIANCVNVLGIFPMNRIKDVENIVKVKFFGHNKKDVLFYPPSDSNIVYPRIKIKNSIYNYEYFIQAEQIGKALLKFHDYEIMMANEDDKPVILVFGEMGVIISPRVENLQWEPNKSEII